MADQREHIIYKQVEYQKNSDRNCCLLVELNNFQINLRSAILEFVLLVQLFVTFLVVMKSV